jgi:hypothetical protein
VKRCSFVPSTPAIPRVSILVMIVFMVATLGLYMPIWFLRRRGALNQLGSPRKLKAWPFVTAICLLAIQIPIELLATTDGGQSLFDLVNLVWTGFFIWQAFRIKRILEDHLFAGAADLPGGVRADAWELSGVFTFFFTIFYLQHVINCRLLDPMKDAARAEVNALPVQA